VILKGIHICLDPGRNDIGKHFELRATLLPSLLPEVKLRLFGNHCSYGVIVDHEANRFYLRKPRRTDLFYLMLRIRHINPSCAETPTPSAIIYSCEHGNKSITLSSQENPCFSYVICCCPILSCSSYSCDSSQQRAVT
jgi:hypothetical protein